MYLFERCCRAIRHSPFLDNTDWLWNWVRPFYTKTLYYFFSRRGLERMINGTDRVLIPCTCRSLSDTYEPYVWKYLMNSVRSGDIVADVGAHIGLYTVALAKRVGHSGQVFAFEPDSKNFSILKETIFLNKVSAQVKLIKKAVASKDGVINFSANLVCGSHIEFSKDKNTYKVPCIKLDTIFSKIGLDILKIDVEGYEEEVLKGCVNLLADQKRKPRFILVELHLFEWTISGTSIGAILDYFSGYNCIILDVNGQRISEIKNVPWCWLIAQKL